MNPPYTVIDPVHSSNVYMYSHKPNVYILTIDLPSLTITGAIFIKTNLLVYQ